MGRAIMRIIEYKRLHLATSHLSPIVLLVKFTPLIMIYKASHFITGIGLCLFMQGIAYKLEFSHDMIETKGLHILNF